MADTMAFSGEILKLSRYILVPSSFAGSSFADLSLVSAVRLQVSDRAIFIQYKFDSNILKSLNTRILTQKYLYKFD